MPPPSSHSILHLPLHFHRRRRRPAAMGCAQGKPSQGSPDRSAGRGIDRLMHEYAYVPFRLSDPLPAPADRPKETDQHDGRGDPVEEKEQAETEEAVQPEPPPPAERRDHELVDGWPRWLLDNVPPEALQGIVPKSADAYDKIDKVGQGTYSNVYKARERGTGRIVALKKVRFDTSESESVKFMAREIRIVQKLDHPNVIKLDGIATSRMHRSIYLVFDFMYSDLARLVCRSDHRLTEPQIKCYMQQLLSGLQHCHERGILHRDIKGSNLLIDRNGVLKIGDFGLANYFGAHRRRPLTSRVVTLWYRAPELLLGSTDYGVGIDLWSAGCLLAEMFFGKPIMPGKTEVEQLFKIFSLCGSPPDDYWRKMKLSASFRPPKAYKSTMLERFRDLPPSCIALLSKLLALDPSARGTAGQALQSKFFSTPPLACDLSSLPVVYKEEVGDPTSSHDGRKPKLRQRSHRKKESKQTTEQSATESRNNDEYPNKEEEIAIDTTPPPPAVQEPETAAIAGASSSTAPKRSSVSPAEALPADQSSPASQEQVPRASSYYSASRRDLTKNYPPLVPPREGPRGGASAEQAGLEKRSSASMAEFRAAALEKDLSKQYVVVDQM